MNGNPKSPPSCVGGVSGKCEIDDVSREHYDKIFNCIQDDELIRVWVMLSILMIPFSHLTK